MKGIIKIVYNKLINHAGLLRCLPYHPVFLLLWPWPLQDPTSQKHPRLGSADMGVGPVHLPLDVTSLL